MTDSHDTNAALQQDALEEDKKQAELTEVPSVETNEVSNEKAEEEADPESKKTAYEPKKTKAEVIERLKELAQDAENADKQELDVLKQTFYKLHKAEQEAARKAFVEAGGEESAFVPQPDNLEEEYKTVMAEIKRKRNALYAEQERLKEENLQKKQEIINK